MVAVAESSISVETSMPNRRAAGYRVAAAREVACGAAADLEHGAAVGRRELRDEAVAPEQEVFAGEVVEMTLMPVDPVHQVGRRRPPSCHPRRM